MIYNGKNWTANSIETESLIFKRRNKYSTSILVEETKYWRPDHSSKILFQKHLCPDFRHLTSRWANQSPWYGTWYHPELLVWYLVPSRAIGVVPGITQSCWYATWNHTELVVCCLVPPGAVGVLPGTTQNCWYAAWYHPEVSILPGTTQRSWYVAWYQRQLLAHYLVPTVSGHLTTTFRMKSNVSWTSWHRLIPVCPHRSLWPGWHQNTNYKNLDIFGSKITLGPAFRARNNTLVESSPCPSATRIDKRLPSTRPPTVIIRSHEFPFSRGL